MVQVPRELFVCGGGFLFDRLSGDVNNWQSRTPEYLGGCLIRFRIKFGVARQGVIQNRIKITEFCKNLSSGFRIKLEGQQGYDLGPD